MKTWRPCSRVRWLDRMMLLKEVIINWFHIMPHDILWEHRHRLQDYVFKWIIQSIVLNQATVKKTLLVYSTTEQWLPCYDCFQELMGIKKSNVTGPPGALLFDRDQRSHWKNHFNCCFVRVAALGIYCTDFLPQMLIQVKYPMPSVGHHIWQ